MPTDANNKNAATAHQWSQWRKKNLLTQKQVSEMLGITERTIQNIESGRTLPTEKNQNLFNILVQRTKNGGR